MNWVVVGWSCCVGEDPWPGQYEGYGCGEDLNCGGK